MDLNVLRPHVIEILRQSDLSKITTKAVRLRLVQDPTYAVYIPAGADLNGAHKDPINKVIKESFTAISEEGQFRQPPNGAALALPGSGGVPGGLPTHPSYPSFSASAAPSGGSSKKRSKAQVSDEIDDDEEPGGATKKKATKKRKTKDGAEKPKRAANPNNPFNAPLILDAILSDVCGGVAELPRPQIVKKIWEHIKGNDLQDPSNKRRILCDDKLQRLFGKDSVDSFEIAKHIKDHVTKKPPVVANGL